MKKIFSLFAAVLMAATMFAEPRAFNGSEILYLNAAAVSWWQDGNAVQIATFDETVKVVGVPAADPTKVGFTVPAGSYHNVAFSRHETAEAPAWNSTGAINLEGTTENMVNSFEQNSSDATWAHYDGGGIDKPVCPDHLYAIGNIEGIGWDPSKGAELTKNGNTFTGKFTFVVEGTNEICYFALTSAKSESSDDWTEVNAHRYGSKDVITAEAPVDLTYPGEKTATIAPGEYTIVVNWDTMTVGIQAATALENAAVATKAVKVIENGQIVILRDGIRFNAIGAQL